VQVGEWQGHDQHHKATQGVENLAPELDFVTLGILIVAGQMAYVLEKLPGSHVVGTEYGCSHHVATDLGGPNQSGIRDRSELEGFLAVNWND